jgi:polysulfide reductase chain B
LKRDEPPACVDICPTGALTFGDLNEAGSKVRKLLSTEVTYQSKTHLGTQPRMYRIPTKRGGINNG